jgi:hypothetical protein
MAKQTAVEWLYDKLLRQGTLYSSDCKQAKQMEKQQIIDAWSDVGADGVTTAEQYYQETYKSEKDKGCACYGNNAVHKCYCK